MDNNNALLSFRLNLELSCPTSPQRLVESPDPHRLRWRSANNSVKDCYRHITAERLPQLPMTDASGLMTVCDLNSAYQALVLCLSQSEDEAQKATCTATTRKLKSVCGWNQLVKHHFENYQKHYWEWKDDIGNENLRQEVQKCKAKFKVALKNCRRDKEKNIADKLATDLRGQRLSSVLEESDSTHQVVVCLTSHKT